MNKNSFRPICLSLKEKKKKEGVVLGGLLSLLALEQELVEKNTLAQMEVKQGTGICLGISWGVTQIWISYFFVLFGRERMGKNWTEDSVLRDFRVFVWWEFWDNQNLTQLSSLCSKSQPCLSPWIMLFLPCVKKDTISALSEEFTF